VDQHDKRNLISKALGAQIPNPGSASCRAGREILDVSPRIRADGGHFATVSFCKDALHGDVVCPDRPVSFNLKHGPEAKYLKFGFIAQELETVFPNLVRTVENTDTKAVASQDLIAVLTLALQNLQKDLIISRCLKFDRPFVGCVSTVWMRASCA
jgi:hypothetical protein